MTPQVQCRLLEKIVADTAGGGLGANAGLGTESLQGDAGGDKGDVPAGAELGDEGGVGVGFWATKLVVEVGDPQPVGAEEFQQGPKQGGAVAPPRESQQEGPGRDAVVPQAVADGVEQQRDLRGGIPHG
jgi:hypothetical protein